ncbi:protein tyrosine phosphatase domain-containing protein 1 isoform X2 [Corythoichthys intestinalis]|uniref:protein tyrosine phosphatase domain-containing protein 1 isoform X2 n=1 Tax=Corythoichthys intestinalis TaxID=161448 RepID=UPI0025A5DA9D|nr:protein tyrosine phosphatase domain-containing protein 1 isoform X2 [Corythoichthys intestinalis]
MQTLRPHVPVPRPAYSQARENLVKAIPSKLLCLLACGGVDCRYEGPECWKANQQVIRGIFSSWVTDDIIAMARPSKSLIDKYNIIEQFQRLNIKSIINMQMPGEHAHCGPPLDPKSGFTYSPQSFMENDSVLIACYLIYTLRISPSEAVHYVRIKRPRSIQTRAQISQVFDFARLLATQLVQYPDLSLRHGAPVTLQHYLNRQALLLHGQEARTLRYIPKVVYLLCVHLCCLAMGLPAAPEINAELEKRLALRILTRVVRDTLEAKQFLPLLRERHNLPRVGSGSVSSWDEPLGFLERKNPEKLLDKRSYSDSDLRKMTLDEDLEMSLWRELDLIGPDLKPLNTKNISISPDLINKKHFHTYVLQRSHNSAQNCMAKKAHAKYSSNIELSKSARNPRPTSVARNIARAMADQGPIEDTVLQRLTLLQEELNSSECGWALVVTESDPRVLTCLLWTWLEKLKEPVLGAEDLVRLSCAGSNKKPLAVLKKSQRHTIYCLLSCVNSVTSLCPHREEAILRRLIRALTKRPQEDVESLASLANILRTHLRDTSRNSTCIRRACSWDTTL